MIDYPFKEEQLASIQESFFPSYCIFARFNEIFWTNHQVLIIIYYPKLNYIISDFKNH